MRFSLRKTPALKKGSVSLAVRMTLVILVGLVSALLWPDPGFAHERWVLSPEQIGEWNAKPLPSIFTESSTFNIAMVTAFVLFAMGWIRLGLTGARELFPDLQARLGSYGDIVAPVLRFCLAWVLISSAFGLEPRYGVERLTSPTLFAPDLELNQFGGLWMNLRWVELLLGLGFLLGIYVRCLAALLLLTTLIGMALFAQHILGYAGALVGIGIYLLLQGPGSYFVPMPTHPTLLPLQTLLAVQPRQRAQAIMRLLTGFNIFYLAVVFKVFQPNLAVAILSIHKVPLLSAAPMEFTLLMTLIEVTSGILIMAGVMLRPLSLFFLFAFFFFAALLPESWTEHMMFYGVMLSLLFNGAGHFHMPEPKDKPANIVVVGGNFAAIHAAMKIEKLIGQYSRVNLTLINGQPNVLFYPLLPEVVGGTMQPGNVVNPIRRVVPRTRVLLGELADIDTVNQHVVISQHDKTMSLPYDELILCLFPVPNLSGFPGLMAHGNPIDSIGDALHIRKRIMDLVEQAELVEDLSEKRRLLTFAVLGSGQRSCATAVEICQMLKTAEISYPILREHGWRVQLHEDTRVPFSTFEEAISAKRNRALEKAGVTLVRGHDVAALTPNGIVLDDGERQPVGMVVNASFTLPTLKIDGRTYHWPLEIADDLRFRHNPHIWVAAMRRQTEERMFLTTADWVDLGRAAGQNAWASSQGFPIQGYKPRKRWLKIFNMGRHSLCQIGPLRFNGTLAWFLSRITNLAALPGLERNLRILIDWFLDVPFRADIAVLTPETTAKLQRLHFEPGDVVIRQGEQGDSAYIVQSGHLEVLKDDKRVGELNAGDYFGEISLIQDTLRTATVRCLSACELTVLTHDDFQSLTIGSSMMAKAIRQQVEERIKAQIA